jgi:hypothetical protein
MAAAMTDHIQNNPFGRSTDGQGDDWSAAQIGGSAGALVITRRSHDCRRGPASAVALANPIVWQAQLPGSALNAA